MESKRRPLVHQRYHPGLSSREDAEPPTRAHKPSRAILGLQAAVSDDRVGVRCSSEDGSKKGFLNSPETPKPNPSILKDPEQNTCLAHLSTIFVVFSPSVFALKQCRLSRLSGLERGPCIMSPIRWRCNEGFRVEEIGDAVDGPG